MERKDSNLGTKGIGLKFSWKNSAKLNGFKMCTGFMYGNIYPPVIFIECGVLENFMLL